MILISTLLAAMGAAAAKRFRDRRPLLVLMFCVYGAVVLYLTLLSRTANPGKQQGIVFFRAAQLIFNIHYGVWETVKVLLGPDWRLSRMHVLALIELRDVILNILLFVPMGYMLPAVFQKVCRWWHAALIALGVSALIEVLQGVLNLGWVEPDDLMHNTVGAAAGFAVWTRMLKREALRRKTGAEEIKADI